MTAPQLAVMSAMVDASRTALAIGAPPNISTRELAKLTGRWPQVVGHSCGALVTAGLLQRKGRGIYRLTAAGIEAWKEQR